MEIKGNSHRGKIAQTNEKKRMNAIVNGGVTTKKKGELSKLTDALISQDASNVGQYLISEVLIPTIKEAIMNSVSICLYGQTGKWAKTSGGSGARVQYQKCYNDGRPVSNNSHAFSYEEPTFDSRGDAEAVLIQLENTLADYGTVNIGDLYDLIGVSCPHTYYNYGWTNLDTAKVCPVPGGFKIKLPKPLPID